MRSTFAKKILPVFIISTLLIGLLPVREAKATTSNLLGSLGGGLFGTLLGCTGASDAITSGIGKLVGKLGIGGKEGGSGKGADESVPTSNTSLETDSSAMKKKESCSDAIAYSLAKTALKKLTESTLNWINSGFQGEPSFVKEPGSFFGSIADEQLGSFTSIIAFDSQNFPFGRATAKNIINSVGSQLNRNAQYSYNELLNDGSGLDLPYEQKFAKFQSDFFYGGGWNGYLTATQLTWTNPADAYFRSVNKIGGEVNAGVQMQSPIKQVEQELAQSGGFLSYKKCVLPKYYEPEANDPSFTRQQAIAQSQNDPQDQDTYLAIRWLDIHTCTRFETQTPGQAIAGQLTYNLTGSNRQLELADELNESLGAVFDALMNQLFQKGVASLSGEDSSNSNVQVFGGYGTNSGSSSFTSGGYSSNSVDQWFNQNQNFDLIATIAPNGPNAIDPDPACHLSSPNPSDYMNDPACMKDGFDKQGLLVLLKEYVAVANETNGHIDKLLRWIGEYDYCVPGPRPDWYNEALSRTQDKMDEVTRLIAAVQGVSTYEDLQAQFDPGGGLSSLAGNLDNFYTYGEKRKQSYYLFKYFSGLELEYTTDWTDEDASEITNPATDISISSNVTKALMQLLQNTDGIHNGYREWVEMKYTNSNNDGMQGLSILNKVEYRKKATYENLFTSNRDDIVVLVKIIPRLEKMYTDLLAARVQYHMDGTPSNSDITNYNRYYSTQLRIFATMVPNIKTGSELEGLAADIDTTKQEVDYIADPVSGLIKDCVDTLPQLPHDINNRQDYLARRPYGGPHATDYDYINDQGWTAAPSFRNQTDRTFLMTGRITGWDWVNATDGDTLNVTTYVQQCREGALDQAAYILRMDIPDSTGAQNNTGACASNSGNMIGDTYENGINSY